MPESKYRFLVIKIIAVIMLAAIVVKLFDLQIIDGDKYLKTAFSVHCSIIIYISAM